MSRALHLDATLSRAPAGGAAPGFVRALETVKV
jgi:hypothetical protein